MSQQQQQPMEYPAECNLSFQFARDGMLVLRQVLDQNTVQEWSTKYHSSQFFPGMFRRLYERGHTKFPTEQTVEDSQLQQQQQQYAMGQGVRHGFREIVMRSPGRYEIAIIENKDRNSIIHWIQRSLPFVPSLFQAISNDDNIGSKNKSEPVLSWNDVQIINVSVVVSTPNAPDQGWHADGAHVSLDKHEPCHCFNIFIPLSDVVTMESGPTALRPGSHVYTRDLARLFWAAKARKTLRQPMAPLLQMGDCLIFDYRILHRGLANTSKDNRTILVVAVARPWFKDIVNFPSNSMNDPPRHV
jgi:hypothetical protein